VAEPLNSDVAQELNERNRHQHTQRWEELAEIVEVIFLAIVATATAWSGYQASRWDGRESALFQDAIAYRFRAESASDLGGLEVVSDSALFTSWLQAKASHDTALASEIAARFTPDFRADFDAWRKTGGLDATTDADVGFKPDLEGNPNVQQAAALRERSRVTFVLGKKADDVADRYVRNTVLLAMVLFLVAIAQRFTTRGLRIGVNGAAFLLLAFVVGNLVTLPRL